MVKKATLHADHCVHYPQILHDPLHLKHWKIKLLISPVN